MNLLQAQNILVDPPKDPTPDEGKTAGPKLLLNDQMISKKYVTKVRDDMNRVKEVLSEMQIKVLEQGHKLDTEVVNETKLNEWHITNHVDARKLSDWIHIYTW